MLIINQPMKRLLFFAFVLFAPLFVVAQSSQLPQYVVFQVTPKTATVVVGDKSATTDSDGIAFVLLNNGTYEYTVSANEYYSKSGLIVLNGEKIVKIVQLDPAYGWLTIPTSDVLKGAKVYVDNTFIGQIPINSCKLLSGTHAIRIEKDRYNTLAEEVTIEDNKTCEYSPQLTPQIGTLNVTSTPAIADVYVDGTYVGQTPLLVSLIIGEHIVFIRKQNVDSDFQYPTVIKDSITDIHLTMRKSAKIAVEEKNIEDDQPFVRVEQMPSFMGGDLTTFRNWVMQQVRYPQIAQDKNITGRVMLQFVIERDGSLTNIKVIQTPDSTLSDEAIRVLKTSPKWTPGRQSNKPARVMYTLPVEFRLQE